MIVPRYQLLFWVGVIVVPGGLVAAAAPPLTLLVWLLVGFLLAAALIDAAWGLGRLRGLTVNLPDVVRLTRTRDGDVPLQIINASRQAMTLRLGLPFPEQVEPGRDDLVVDLPEGHEEVSLNYPCVGLQRGRYSLERCYFERRSPMGFWALRGNTAAATELRVYPNLKRERRNLAALFLNSSNLGIHAQRVVGKGRDFEKLREYIPGDSYEDIHWRASAKRGHPVTKVYQIERTQEVYVVIDASRLSARQADPADPENWETQLERFLTAALVLGLAAEKQGDNFGLIVFGDKVDTFVRARNGKAHYGICRDALYTQEPQLVNPDFEEMARFVRTNLTRRALLLFLTNLDDPVLAENFTENIQLVSRQHLTLVNMLVPPGVQPIFTNPGVHRLADVYRHLGGHYRWHELRELERVLQRQGVRFQLLQNEGLCADLVTQYVGVKQRQLI